MHQCHCTLCVNLRIAMYLMNYVYSFYSSKNVFFHVEQQINIFRNFFTNKNVSKWINRKIVMIFTYYNDEWYFTNIEWIPTKCLLVLHVVYLLVVFWCSNKTKYLLTKLRLMLSFLKKHYARIFLSNFNTNKLINIKN